MKQILWLLGVSLCSVPLAAWSAPESGVKDSDLGTYTFSRVASPHFKPHPQPLGADICVQASELPSIEGTEIQEGVYDLELPAQIAGDPPTTACGRFPTFAYAPVKIIAPAEIKAAHWNNQPEEQQLPKQFTFVSEFTGKEINEAYAKVLETCKGKRCYSYRLTFVTDYEGISIPLPLPANFSRNPNLAGLQRTKDPGSFTFVNTFIRVRAVE